MDYSELSEAVYGQRYSSDTARRMMYGSAKTIQLLEGERERLLHPGPVVSADTEQQLVELRKERQRLSDQRREYNKAVTASGRTEYLYERLEAAARALPKTVGSLFSVDETSLRIVDGVKPTGTEAVLVLSDWHYGLVAKNIWNIYDTEVCKERVRGVVHDAA